MGNASGLADHRKRKESFATRILRLHGLEPLTDHFVVPRSFDACHRLTATGLEGSFASATKASAHGRVRQSASQEDR